MVSGEQMTNLIESFSENPNLLYDSMYEVNHLSGGFLASNEFDWNKEPIDSRDSDLFVGFGNNSVWDLAVRRNAKAMVIGEIDRNNCLLGQEYFFRPLVLSSDTPADFLSMLSVVPIDENCQNMSINKVFDIIDKKLDLYPPESPDVEERKEFLEKIIKNVEKLSLGENYTDLLREKLERSISPYRGTDFERYMDRSPSNPKKTYYYFRDRYKPSELFKRATSRLFDDPMFSFLSSQDAFDRLKRLFDGNTYYVASSFDDPDAYSAIGALADEKDMKVSGLSISNIIDSLAKRYTRKADLLGRVCNNALSRLPVDDTFTVYITTGVDSIHKYNTICFNPDNNLTETLKSAGYDTSCLNLHSDYERALETISEHKPQITEANAYGLRLYVGDLHFYFHKGDKKFAAHTRNPDNGLPEDNLIFTGKNQLSGLYSVLLGIIKRESFNNEGVKEFVDSSYPHGIPDSILEY